MRLSRSSWAMLIATLAARVLSAQAPSPDDAEKAVRAKLKSDLRNLVTAQEAYYADHSAYADVLDNLKFRPSTGAQIRLTATHNNAWGAMATDESMPGKSCVIFVNLAQQYRPKTLQDKRVGSSSEEGAPICDDDPKPEK